MQQVVKGLRLWWDEVCDRCPECRHSLTVYDNKRDICMSCGWMTSFQGCSRDREIWQALGPFRTVLDVIDGLSPFILLWILFWLVSLWW